MAKGKQGKLANKSVIDKAIGELSKSVNLTSPLSHASDESHAKQLLIALRDRGLLEPSEIRKAAIKRRWPEKDADQLAEWAERLKNGGRVLLKQKGEVGERLLKIAVGEDPDSD